MGKVYLIGVGPGDEKLISLKALEVIKKADVIFYDRLTPKSILNYRDENSEIYYCGKSPKKHYKTQEEINRLLVEFAKKDKIVARIKGGDPYIFGRGAEEAEELLKNDIEFETISGIPSFSSVLNYSGIPVTYRNISRSFHVFTGQDSENSNLNWGNISKLEGTLIFMMGLGNLKKIIGGLIKAGKNLETPVGVIMKGTTSKQKKVIGNLSNIVEKVENAKLESPVIIVIGEVVKFESNLDWYSKKPLFGLNICITRSKEQAEEMKNKLYNLGAQITEINSIKFEKIENSLDPFINNIDEYDHIVLNSVNGIKFFFDEIQRKEIDIRKIRAKFPAIGTKTALELRKRGIIPSIIAKNFTLEGLYNSIKEDIKDGEKILIIKSENGRNFLIEKLKERKIKLDYFNLYRTLKGDYSIYNELKDVDIIIFTSPSTFKNIYDNFGKEELENKKIISIGPITTKAIEEKGLKCITSDIYTVDGIIEKILKIKR